jgi:fucokinase
LRAGQRGGLRSGPAANGEWTAALHTLRAGELRAAVASLAAVRAAWVGADEPRMLVRAARHYEGAVGRGRGRARARVRARARARVSAP